ncbi:hypothetical protein SO180_40490 [Bradyrhizobium sp. UFLA05-112]
MTDSKVFFGRVLRAPISVGMLGTEHKRIWALRRREKTWDENGSQRDE